MKKGNKIILLLLLLAVLTVVLTTISHAKNTHNKAPEELSAYGYYNIQ